MTNRAMTEPTPALEPCPTCQGEGDVPALIDTPTGPVACPYIGEPCSDCDGTGRRALAEEKRDG